VVVEHMAYIPPVVVTTGDITDILNHVIYEHAQKL
jgi:hypothetical protein